MTVDPWHVAWLEAEQAQVSGHAVRDVVRVEAPEAPNAAGLASGVVLLLGSLLESSGSIV